MGEVLRGRGQVLPFYFQVYYAIEGGSDVTAEFIRLSFVLEAGC